MTTTFPIIRLEAPSGTVEYSGDQVISSEVVQEIDHMALSLPASTLEFLAKSDGSFTIFSDDIPKRTPIMAYQRIDDDVRLIGRFFLVDWENPSQYQVKFYATDHIGILEYITFDGIFWPSPVSVQAALEQTLGVAGVPYSIAPSLADTQVSGWIAPGTLRNALRQICFASAATAVTQGRLDIYIDDIGIPNLDFDVVVSDSVRLDNSNPSVAAPVSMIELISHDYTQGTEEEVVFDQVLPAGPTKIVFSQPYYSLTVDGPGFISVVLGFEDDYYFATEDGDFLEVAGEFLQGVNSITPVLTEPGLVTITGYRWVDSQRAWTYRAPADVGENNILIRDATLVNADRAPALLERLTQYYGQRYSQQMTLLPTGVGVGDIAVSGTHYAKYLIGVIARQVLDMSGGFLMESIMRGIEIVLVPPLENPYRRPRSSIAICGTDMTRQNMFREYA